MLRSEQITTVSNDIKELKEAYKVTTNPMEKREIELQIIELEEYLTELKELEEKDVH